MKPKILILAILLILVLAGFITGVSLYLQPGQSLLGVFIIIGSASVGAATLVGGLKDADDLLGKTSHEDQSSSSRSSNRPSKVSAKGHSIAVGGDSHGNITNIDSRNSD